MRLASQKINLCNIPAWVRAAYPGIWPSLSLAGHFDQGLYWAKGVGQCSPDALFSCTRGSTKYVATASGLLVPIPVNGLPIGAGNGNLVEQAATNLALQSQTLDNAQWTKTHGGTASTPTVTADAGVAPDGTTTADRVQFALNGGTTISDISQILSSSITVTSGVSYIITGYAKSNTASSYVMQIDDDVAGTNNGITVTPTWARFSVTFTTGSTSSKPEFRLRGGATPTNSDSADILLWGIQLELGTFPTSYIPTTTVAVTRAADSIVPAGTAANAFKPAAISIFVQSNNVASFSGFPRYIGYSNGHSPLQITNNTKTSTYNGSVELDATLGSGTVTGGTVKTAVGYDGTGRSIVANNGTVATDANVEALGANTVFIGAQSAGGQFLNGYMARLAVFGGRLSDAQLTALST